MRASLRPNLVEPEIDPGYDEAGAEHGAVGALHHPDGPHDEGEAEHGQRNVPVGDLAQGGPGQDVVGHHLLHGYAHPGQVAGQPVDVDVEQELRVEGGHVEDVVEEGREGRHPHVDNEEESDHLQGAPERLYELAHQDECEDVHQDLPGVDLQEAVSERRPEPEVWRVEVARRHGEGEDC